MFPFYLMRSHMLIDILLSTQLDEEMDWDQAGGKFFIPPKI